MDKQQLKSALIAMQERIVGDLEEQVELYHGQVDIDENATKDPEDYSHQYESSEYERLLKDQVTREKNTLYDLKNMNYGPKDSVTEGAYVRTSNHHFFIGAPTVPFDFGDISVVGISTVSPIYLRMQGLKAGAQFSFRGHDYKILEIE